MLSKEKYKVFVTKSDKVFSLISTVRTLNFEIVVLIIIEKKLFFFWGGGGSRSICYPCCENCTRPMSAFSQR